MKIDALSEPSFMKAWRGQIKKLEAETSALQKECEQHTGIIGWNNYIASSASLQLMKTLHNHLFAGTAKRLQKD